MKKITVRKIGQSRPQQAPQASIYAPKRLSMKAALQAWQRTHDTEHVQKNDTSSNLHYDTALSALCFTVILDCCVQLLFLQHTKI